MGSKRKTSRPRSPSPPPERPPYVFFADRDLAGKTFLQGLRDAGLAVESFELRKLEPRGSLETWWRP